MTHVLTATPEDVTQEVERFVSTLDASCSALVTGSLVEGLGNRYSDVDLYVIVDDGRPRQQIAIGLRASRFIDCEYFAADALATLASRFEALSWRDVYDVRRSEIDRYYRLAIAVRARTTERAAQLLPRFVKDNACGIYERWALLRAYERLGLGVCMLSTGRNRAAELMLREAALWLGNSTLAGAGEGYPNVKWLGEKAARRFGRGSAEFHAIVDDCVRPTGGPRDLVERLRSRMPFPAGLATLLETRQCELADRVKLVAANDGTVLALRSTALHTVEEPVSTLLSHLARAMAWP